MKRIPHTFTIVFALIVLAAVMTWVVPAGEFLRQTVDGREMVVNGSFHYVDRAPQTWQIFSALFNGFVDKADII
ncbi:MAG: YfcC family protein, partial [Bacteroidales bacterium]|nr:YfcC family protein [Bacteroidales bacterium]